MLFIVSFLFLFRTLDDLAVRGVDQHHSYEPSGRSRSLRYPSKTFVSLFCFTQKTPSNFVIPEIKDLNILTKNKLWTFLKTKIEYSK